MTNRERAMNILHFKSVDRLPAVHFGYWSELLSEWAEQGHITPELAKRWRDGNDVDRELDRLIGWDFNWYTTVGGSTRLFPSFKREVLDTFSDGTQRVLTGNGVIEKIKPGVVSIPSEDDYLLKDREAFETLFKPKMQFSEARVAADRIKQVFAEKHAEDIPVGLHIGSVMGEVRNIATVLGMSYLIYDEDEDLFADVVDTFADM